MIPSIEQKLNTIEALCKELDIPYVFILQDSSKTISYSAYTPPDTNAVLLEIFKNLVKKDIVLGEAITNYEAVYVDAIDWDYEMLSKIPEFVKWEKIHAPNCSACNELLTYLKTEKIRLNKDSKIVADVFARKISEQETLRKDNDLEFDFGSVKSI